MIPGAPFRTRVQFPPSPLYRNPPDVSTVYRVRVRAGFLFLDHHMKFNPDIHHRHSIRLPGYDYSQAGAYFVTICTAGREYMFGEIIDGKVVPNDAGEIVKSVWNELPNHYPHVELDQFVIMPNHFHGIIVLLNTTINVVGAGLKPAPTVIKRHGLPEIIRGFKTFSARRINEINKSSGSKLWQRNYYEHIIRNGYELDRIRHYIFNNPQRWVYKCTDSGRV